MATILAEAPALPLHTAGKYVAAAYIVLFLVILVYVAVMATRLSRIERELGQLLELAPAPEPTPALAVHDLDLDGPRATPRTSSTPAASPSEATTPQ